MRLNSRFSTSTNADSKGQFQIPISPSTTFSLSGVLGNNEWFTSEVSVILSATDDIKVDKVEYSFDNITWVSYITPFNITNEGDTIVYYKSTDIAGNSETIKTNIIKIDKTSPTIIIASPSPGSEIKSSSVSVTLTGSDETSGISYYEIRLDDGLWTNIGASTTHTFTGLSDGSHTIEVRAIDNAGLTNQDSVDFIVNTSPLFGPGYTEEAAILAVAIIVAIGIALYFLKLRKS